MAIYQTATYEVKPEALAACKRAIRAFVEHVKANEPGTFRYIALQDKQRPTRFLHFFIFANARARRLHANSDAVNRFTSILYPNCVAPVEFTGYGAVSFKGQTIRDALVEAPGARGRKTTHAGRRAQPKRKIVRREAHA
jgi:quinol monooxygenase YgiN